MSDHVAVFANRRAHRRWLDRVLTDTGTLMISSDATRAAVAVADLADGLEAVLTHMADYPDLPFVVCHEDDHDDRCRMAAHAGASECVRLDADGSRLRTAAERAVAGDEAELLIPRPELMERIFSSTADRSLDTDAQIDEVLRLGCQRFDQDIGLVVRIVEGRADILAAHDRRGALRKGAALPLERVAASIAASAGRAVGEADLARSPWRSHPQAAAGLQSYIGVPITADGRISGAVEFAAELPRVRPFEDRDLEFVAALGEWVDALLIREHRMRQLEVLVTHDRLTGLPNREAILHRLERSVRRAETIGDYGFALLFIDLEGFDELGRSLGRAGGDSLLQQVARRIREVVRPKDVVGRFAADEFAVLVEDADLDGARTVADRIVAALGRPFRIGDRAIIIEASVGVAMGTTADSARELVIAADEALYSAKSTGQTVVTLASTAAGPPETD